MNMRVLSIIFCAMLSLNTAVAQKSSLQEHAEQALNNSKPIEARYTYIRAFEDYAGKGQMKQAVECGTKATTSGKGYGNLAANIGPTSENPFTNTISNQSFNCSKESVFRQFRTSRASHSLEALSNHMWPEKPIQAG